jgi:hypothetical protein
MLLQLLLLHHHLQGKLHPKVMHHQLQGKLLHLQLQEKLYCPRNNYT